jgi:hypothetical protein
MGCECSAEFFDPTPTEEIFLVDSLDDLAATSANELSWFVKQSLGTYEFEPVGYGCWRNSYQVCFKVSLLSASI